MAFDKGVPLAGTSLRSSNPQILSNWDGLETAIGKDHDFATGGTQTGKHKTVTMQEQTSPGASSTNEGNLAVVDAGTQPELEFTSEDGNANKLTSGGNLNSDAGLIVAEDITVNTDKFTVDGATGNTLVAGTLDVTGDVAVNTDKFNVTAASGNTAIAGTLDVTDAAEVVGVATLGDGSKLKTSAAPTADAQIANMKYVDDNTGAANYDPTEYIAQESNTFPNGLIMKMGIAGGGSANTVVSFAEAFPTALKTLTLSHQKATETGNSPVVKAQSASGFTINSTATITAHNWIAMGY